MGKNWYVIHTYSGYENKVKTNLEQRLQGMGLVDKISQIVVPTEEVTEIRGGKKKKVLKKFFPGYVLIEMEMSDETWHIVRHTSGVFGFIGDKNKPIPLDESQVKEILQVPISGVSRLKPSLRFEKNEPIRVIQGPFTNFIGTVGEMDPKQGKLKVMMNILGRTTPVELEVYQVEKL
ncbi:MAG: transcription termination/antitermination protein NusG [Nitrospirota bacterium]